MGVTTPGMVVCLCIVSNSVVPNICTCGTVTVTLLGSRVFVDIIELREDHTTIGRPRFSLWVP